MKLKGSFSYYQRKRDCDLIRVYNETVGKEKYPFRLLDVMKKVVCHPSVAFWVSEDRALDIISRMRRGEDANLKYVNKKLMFDEIFRRVNEVEKEHPNDTLIELIRRVIYGKAPSFYITPASAIVIIHKIKKKWRKEKSLLCQLRH